MRVVLCTLLCIGATLDDIDYINAIRAPRTMNGSRGSTVADDDSDDQHTHFALAPINEAINLSAPFLSTIDTVRQPKPVPPVEFSTVIRSGRAPPSVAV